MHELTSAMCAVLANAFGSVLQNLRICGPVKRSNVSEPVREAVNLMPPSFLRISAHSFAVEESIQMGEVLRAKTPVRFSTSDFLGSRFSTPAPAFSLR